jgi:GDPmannose 4,6-dehydratase
MQWLMLQQDKPEDFVIATGQQYSVREFITRSAARLGMEIEWTGSGVNDDASKAREKIGWKPKHTFQQLVDEMTDADLLEAESELRAAAGRRRSLY